MGGLSDRGVVSTANYTARRLGIHSAMPMYRARKLCPDGFFIRPRMRRYKEVSETVMQVLCSFSPLVEQASIDEAYLDITGCEKLFGTPAETGKKSGIKFTPISALPKLMSLTSVFKSFPVPDMVQRI